MQASHSASSHDGHIAYPPPAVKMQKHDCNVSAQKSPVETPLSKFLLGGGHISLLLVVCQNYESPSPQKQAIQHKLLYCLHILGTVNLHYQLPGDILGTKFPEPSQRPVLQAGLSRHSNLRAALLSFFLHYYMTL